MTLKCGGFTKDKYNIIKEYDIDWKKMPIYCWVGDWICTHAGISMNFLKSNNIHKLDMNEILQRANDSLLTIDNIGESNIFLQAGEMRGNLENEYGGILWCDYCEFEDVPNTKQIFGHTVSSTVRRLKSELAEHICIDTGGKHYAIYNSDTKSMTVMKI